MTAAKKSQKKLSQAENGQIVNHATYIKTYRTNVMRVMRDIEKGTVSIEDLAKLRNFLQMSFSLMETAPIHQIQSAWRHVEILAFTHQQVEDVEDYAGVLGKTEFNQVESKGIQLPPPKEKK
jgi:hypothetical protein